MNPSDTLLDVLVSILTALFLLAVGYFSLFRSKELTAFYLRATKNQINYIVNRSWFYINMKICGAVFMLVGLTLLIYVLSIIIHA